MGTAQVFLRNSETTHIAGTSSTLRAVGNFLRSLQDDEFRQEAILLAGDKHRGDRLLQLLLGEAEARSGLLAHEVIDAARNAAEVERDPVLAEALKDIEESSPGA